MLMHAENSSLQDSSAQRCTDPVLSGTGVPPTASQTTALSHQCRKYLAKTATTLCQGPTYLPRPPNLPATHLPTSLTRAHPSATHTTRSSRDRYILRILFLFYIFRYSNIYNSLSIKLDFCFFGFKSLLEIFRRAG